MRLRVGPRIVTLVSALRLRTFDLALAAIVVTVALAGLTFGIDSDADPGARSFDVLAAVLVVAAGGVLALHRRAPMVVLAVTTAAVAVYSLRDYSGAPVYLMWIGAVFTVSVGRGPTRAWAPVAVSTAVVLVTVFAVGGHVVGERLVEDRDSADAVIAAVLVSWVGAALLLGGSVRGRRIERAAAEERAQHLVATREEEARRRVAEERVRIARDLHDSVAHTLASISVRAGVGAHVLAERPDDAQAALLAIKDTSRQALTELRTTLGMLRSDEAAPREPRAGLDRLPSLVETTRAAGLPVDVVIDESARPLPPAVDTAAFRIVQESLTNVIRHAGPARATVVVRHGDDSVEIEVTDDGRGAAASDDGGGGHGLAGMRERVNLLGGQLHAGSGSAGGYRVWARFPL